MTQELRRSICGLICVICLFCGAVQAQGTIRGDVVHADTITKAEGIVVIASDSAGNEIARALSGSNGSYSIIVAPGRYTLRALRVGFRPTVTPPITVADNEVKVVRIILAGAAVQLNLVKVEGERGSCTISADKGLLVAGVWDQARTGLMASTLSAGGRPFEATLATYRQYTPKGNRVIEAETLTVVRQTTTTGFLSVPAESLAANGFVTVRGLSVSYHAPDAHALLSPLFEASHCFDVRAGAGDRAEWIGIAFRPARRGNNADVEGVLWLDRGSSELRLLEFAYTNLPRNAAGGAASGSVAFVRLVSGDWIVSRWAIKSPETEMVEGGGRAVQYRIVGSRVVGGYTMSVEQEGGRLFRQPGSQLSVALKSKDSSNAVDGGFVRVAGTRHTRIADSTGIASLEGLAEGTYTIIAATRFMNRVGALPAQAEVTVAFDKASRLDITLPSMREIADAACGRVGFQRLVHGRVETADHRPVGNAKLLFQGIETREVERGRRRVMEREPVSLPTRTDLEGYWRACLSGAYSTLTLSVDDKVVWTRSLSQISVRRYEPVILTVP